MKAFLSRMPRYGTFRRRLLPIPCLLAGAVMLAGCVQSRVASSLKTTAQPREPEQQLADYLTMDCEDIWTRQGNDAIANPLYWLRGMDCAQRLPPAQARAEARQQATDSWADTFRRGILLSTAKITPTERRFYMLQLGSMTSEVPAAVRPLFQVWYDGQNTLLELSGARSRYSKLQQTSDDELDALREQQQRVHKQLELTTRKLENLTDIERQLSSRKPGGNDVPDNHNTVPDDDDTAKPQPEAKP